MQARFRSFFVRNPFLPVGSPAAALEWPHLSRTEKNRSGRSGAVQKW